MTTCYLSRTDAADVISESITTGTEYVITVPPNLIQELGQSLDLIPEWTAYLDNGTSAVMVTSEGGALTIVHLLAVAAAVVIVPKSVTPEQLSKAVRQDIAADGSQDLLILHEGEGEAIVWPMLFVDALAHVDPDAAERIRGDAVPLPGAGNPHDQGFSGQHEKDPSVGTMPTDDRPTAA